MTPTTPPPGQPGEPGTPKLVQICASHNDLFGLDETGQAYQYNFSTNAWTRLGALPDHDEASAGAGGHTATATPRRSGLRDAGTAP